MLSRQHLLIGPYADPGIEEAESHRRAVGESDLTRTARAEVLGGRLAHRGLSVETRASDMPLGVLVQRGAMTLDRLGHLSGM